MKTELESLIKRLVAIPSPYPSEIHLTRYLTRYLQRGSCRTYFQRIAENRHNILAEKGMGKTSILLYAHQDTVPVVQGWTTPPHRLTITGDRAQGLGAWDMKAGLAIALKLFSETEPKNIRLKLALCVDEEDISRGGHTLISSPFMEDVSSVISLEPAFFHEEQGIVTGRIGRAVYVVTITGTPQHFAFYTSEEDINLIATNFIAKLQKMKRNRKDGGRQFAFVRRISSESVGMSTPAAIHLEIDCSLLNPETTETILLKIRSIAADIVQNKRSFQISVHPLKRETPFLEGYQIRNRIKPLTLLGQSVKKITGKDARPYFRSSVADENIFGSHGYTVLGLGPRGGNAHAPDEWVSLKSVHTVYNIVGDYIRSSDHQLPP